MFAAGGPLKDCIAREGCCVECVAMQGPVLDCRWLQLTKNKKIQWEHLSARELLKTAGDPLLQFAFYEPLSYIFKH